MRSRYLIRKGDRIAQMIPLPVMTGNGILEVDELAPAVRGANGFGSTRR
jgi:dUTPase